MNKCLTGEPCAVKVASTVRREVVGKVFDIKNILNNSLASYPTS